MWVIQHFRRLFGLPTNITNDARLYLESRWADERKYTNEWNVEYPGIIGSNEGPCNITDYSENNQTCGSSFFPNSIDRQSYITKEPYLATHYGGTSNVFPELSTYDNPVSQWETMDTVDANIPWSIKLSYILARIILKDGLEGPIFNPLYSPVKFGCSWWLKQPYTATSGELMFRAKWM